MSLVKVNLMSDLNALALALYPFMQRKGDQNYQRATAEYSKRLRRLHRSSVEAKRLRSSRSKLTHESDTFRLDGNTQTSDSLHGITIAKSSFPAAQVEEPVVLVRSAGENEQQVEESIAHGLIQAVSESEIKIKLLKPLKLVEKSKQEQETAAVKSTELSEPAAEPQVEEQKDGNEGGKSKETSGIVAVEEKKEKKIIEFKVKHDASKLRATPTAIDEYGLLVMKTVNRFEAIKCDSVLHRNLLGLYDERTELLHEKTRVMTFDELIEPRGQQRLAIEQALKRRMSLIEGPAGSGKTLVAALIAGNMSRLKRAKILVCSPIQESIDRLAELIDKIEGVQVVKIPDGPVKLTLSEMLGHAKAGSKRGSETEVPRTRLEVRDESSKCLLDKLVDDKIYLQVWARSKDSFRNNHDSLHSHAYRMVTGCSQHRRRKIEAKILSRADVVCCSNKQAGSYLLSNFQFDMLILDDVQISSEIDCLVPMMARGIRQVVLLSDSRKQIRLARTLKKSQSNGQLNSSNHVHDQTTMKPTAITRANGSLPNRGSLKRTRSARRSRELASRRNTLGQNNTAKEFCPCDVNMEPGGLFERLLAIGLPTVDLRIQFRLHETLSNFTNHHFYLGRLKNHADTNKSLQDEIEQKLLTGDERRFDWLPNRKYLTAMFNVRSQAEPASSSSSGNDASSSRDQIMFKQIFEKLEELTDKFLFHENIQESRIGILMNRRFDQEATLWPKKIPRNIKIGTIADFIGQERDFTILVAFPPPQKDEDRQSTLAQLSICSELDCDFQHNDTALNCALTRARLGMMLIASDITVDEVRLEASSVTNEQSRTDSATAHGCRGWRDLVGYYKASGLLVG